MDSFRAILEQVGDLLWHDVVLYLVLAVGVMFTIRTRFSQWHSLTHGVGVLLGKYDRKDAPGAIGHFQALSAALSATVGLGNIGGVALGISLGGPGAVFWMWVIGLFGMALKTAEVTLSMLYRDLTNPSDPHGGPMFVARAAFARRGLPRVGKIAGGVFVVTLLVSSVTGGNMFQAWNVAEVTHQSFGMPKIAAGVLLAAIVAAVILGGIRRIGAVAGTLVPLMCVLYLTAAVVVVLFQWEAVPETLRSIVTEAFRESERQGAFIGGSAGYALLWGMKRALFSSEAGQGSSPIAHCAAKTDEPVREGVLAGLEPFIDTLVVCTLTALVLLLSGVWCREPDIGFEKIPQAVAIEGEGAWSLTGATLVDRGSEFARARVGSDVFTVVRAGQNSDTGNTNHRLAGTIVETDPLRVAWEELRTSSAPLVEASGVWLDDQGAALTARSFDRAVPGLGKWLVTFAAWLFAISTMISWSYYAEQGVIFLLGTRFVAPFKVLYCLLIVVATIPTLVRTDAELDDLTSLGTGVMLWANIPILVLFGGQAVGRYREYFGRLRSIETPPAP